MKKIIYILFGIVLSLGMIECTDDVQEISGSKVVLRGNSGSLSNQTRVSFGEVGDETIPFLWSKGDVIWINGQQSSPVDAITDETDFVFDNLSGSAPFKIYYNMTGEKYDEALIPSLQYQSGAGVTSLGANGGFGYSVSDDHGNFVLKHQASYIWFAPFSTDIINNNLISISVSVPETKAISGKASFKDGEFDINEGQLTTSVVLGDNGFVLPEESSFENVFAALVVFPVDLTNEFIDVVYTFSDGTIYSEKKSGINIQAGKTYRIESEIKKDDLKKAISYQADGGEWSDTLPDSFTKLVVKSEFVGLSVQDHNAIIAAMQEGAELDFSQAINDTEVFGTYYKGNKKLKSISLPNNLTEFSAGVFDQCTSLESVTVQEGVVKFQQMAFNGCANLKTVNLPSTLTEVARRTFYDCVSLEQISLPDNLTTLGDYTFWNCESLKSIDLPKNLSTIGTNTFYNCKSLESIEIPGSLKVMTGTTLLNGGMFYNCKSLKEVKLNEGIEEVGAQTFYNCWAIEELVLPSTVKTVGRHALYDMRSLKSVYLDTESLGDYSMWTTAGESSLTTVIFGPRVTSIGQNALLNARKLSNIKFESIECPSIWGNITFQGAGISIPASQRKIYIPEGSYDSYNSNSVISYLVETMGYTIVEGGDIEDQLTDGVYYSSTGNTGDWEETIDGISGNYIYVKTVGEQKLTNSDLTGIESFINQNKKLTVLDMSDAVYESNNIPDMFLGGYMGNAYIFEIAFPKNIEVIGTNVCSYSGNLRAVRLGENVKEIGEYSFTVGGSDKRAAFVCEATAPPVLNDDGYPTWSIPFGGGNAIPMYVPNTSVEAYKTANKWSTYLVGTGNITIKSLSELTGYPWRSELE